MRTTIISLAFLLSLPTFSQSDSIYYEIPIYFEDAVGNKDTVYIGLSEYATNEIDAQFGEVNLIDVPFDSVFEVRLTGFDDLSAGGPATYLGKKKYLNVQFTNDDPLTCNGIRLSDGISFVAQSMHPPLTIKWDSELFRSGGDLHCLGGSWLNNTHAPLVLFGWEEFIESSDAYTIACLMDEMEEVTIMPYNLVPFEDGSVRDYDSNFFQDFTLSSVEGSEFMLDTLVIYNLWWRYFFDDLCLDLVSDYGPREQTHFQLFPNPVLDDLSVAMLGTIKEGVVHIYSLEGRLLKSHFDLESSIDVVDLPPGLYVARVIFKNGKEGVRKFVKL